MTDKLTRTNEMLRIWSQHMYDGHDDYIEIEGGCLLPFLGTRIDLELTVTNCVGDKSTYRNFVEVTDQVITMYDELGNKVRMSGTNCTQKCPEMR